MPRQMRNRSNRYHILFHNEENSEWKFTGKRSADFFKNFLKRKRILLNSIQAFLNGKQEIIA